MNTEKPSTQVTVHQPTSQWQLIQRQCRAFLESGFLPRHVQNLAQAITIAWKGQELGIPPLHAFSSIAVINGKPALSAELMLSLVYSRLKGAKITFTTPPEKQATECTVVMQRPGGDAQTFRFTLEDAKKAGLYPAKPDSAWMRYTGALLRARTVAMGCRAVFPDCLMGCVYTPEELGHDVIDIEVESLPVEAGAQTAPPSPHANPKAPTGNTTGYDERHAARMAEPATEAQGKKIFAMSKELGYDDDQRHDLMDRLTGKESSRDLTKGEASTIIEELNRELNAATKEAVPAQNAGNEGSDAH